MSIIVLLIVLGAGLFVGSHFESAHDAHKHYSTYRARTNASFGAWLKNTIVVGVGIVVLILLLIALLYHGQ